MATPVQVLQDDKFWALPTPERVKVLSTLDPNFGGLGPAEQLKVVGSRPTQSTSPPPTSGPMSLLHGANFGRPTEPTPQMSEFLKATGGPGGPIQGGPVLPQPGQLLSMAVGTAGGALAGTGAAAGARKLGVPEGPAELIGAIVGLGAGVLTGSRTGLLRQALGARSEPGVQEALWNIWKRKGLGGWAELKTALNPPEPVPQAPTPFKPSAGTARSMGKYTPADDPYGGPSYQRAPGRGKLTSTPSDQSTQVTNNTGGEVDFGDLPVKYQTGAAAKAREIAGNRLDKVSKLVDLARKNGITKDQISGMTKAQRKMFAKAGGYAEISDITLSHILDEL